MVFPGWRSIQAAFPVAYSRAILAWARNCVQQRLRRDQCYELDGGDGTFRAHRECPFHLAYDDHVNDLGRDLIGRSSCVLVSSASTKLAPEQPEQWHDVPNVLRDAVFAKPLGRGFRIVPFLGADALKFDEFLECVGLVHPSSCGEGEVLKVRSWPF